MARVGPLSRRNWLRICAGLDSPGRFQGSDIGS